MPHRNSSSSECVFRLLKPSVEKRPFGGQLTWGIQRAHPESVCAMEVKSQVKLLASLGALAKPQLSDIPDMV